MVALDQAGNLAAGTSTGGTVLKMPGRVGDSPIIGAGTYANNDSCAVSATGTGRVFHAQRRGVGHLRARTLPACLARQAANDVVMKELVAQHGDGGVIALDRQGNIATPFNTTGMMTGAVRNDGKIKMSGGARARNRYSPGAMNWACVRRSLGLFRRAGRYLWQDRRYAASTAIWRWRSVPSSLCSSPGASCGARQCLRHASRLAPLVAVSLSLRDRDRPFVAVLLQGAAVG